MICFFLLILTSAMMRKILIKKVSCSHLINYCQIHLCLYIGIYTCYWLNYSTKYPLRPIFSINFMAILPQNALSRQKKPPWTCHKFPRRLRTIFLSFRGRARYCAIFFRALRGHFGNYTAYFVLPQALRHEDQRDFVSYRQNMHECSKLSRQGNARVPRRSPTRHAESAEHSAAS